MISKDILLLAKKEIDEEFSLLTDKKTGLFSKIYLIEQLKKAITDYDNDKTPFTLAIFTLFDLQACEEATRIIQENLNYNVFLSFDGIKSFFLYFPGKSIASIEIFIDLTSDKLIEAGLQLKKRIFEYKGGSTQLWKLLK